MPDDIALINGRRAMAYQGETPWHNLGVKADEILSVDAALKLANLDWEVKLAPMYIPSFKNKTGHHIADWVRVPGRQAIVRPLDDVVLGTCGMSYEPIQNRPGFEILDVACKEFGVQIETAGALGKGELVWMLAKLPHNFDVVDGDKVDSYFLVSLGHDGATPHTSRPTPVRVVCRNTLQMAMGSKAVIRMTHAGNVSDKLKAAQKLVTDLIKTMTITGDTFRKMALRKMNEHEMQAYVHAVLRIEDGSAVEGILARRRDTIVNLTRTGRGAEFAPETLWTCYNAFTEYYDHYRPAEVNPVKKLKAQESALFGANAAMKARALELAERLLEPA